MLDPTQGIVLAGRVAFDAVHGIGVPRGGEPHCAFVALRPSAFLALATPLQAPRPSLGWLRERMAGGSTVCPASLSVWLSPTGQGTVTAHDGRHRMMAVLELVGDLPVPVILRLVNGETANMGGAELTWLARGMRSQRGRRTVPGPLFLEAVIDGCVWRRRRARLRARARGPPKGTERGGGALAPKSPIPVIRQ